MKPIRSFLVLLFLSGVSMAGTQPGPLLYPIPANSGGFQSGAKLGSSVAADGNRTVVGIPLDDFGAKDAGFVKVFDSTKNAVLYQIPNPNPEIGDQFGTAVAISGNRVVVGVPLDSVNGSRIGAVYVYDLSSNTPTVPIATLPNPQQVINANFGGAVAIAGNRVVVGASRNIDASKRITGFAYVYDFSSGIPTAPTVTLNTLGSLPSGSLFGSSVAISETRVAVGAPNNTSYATGGVAYVFNLLVSDSVIILKKSTGNESRFQDQFGSAVGISGTRVVVGVPGDDTGASNAGSASVYDVGTTTPTVALAVLNNPVPVTGNNFGSAVAISGTRVVVGSPKDDTSVPDSGVAWVYDVAGSASAFPTFLLTNPTPSAFDNFGFAVAISGTRVSIGAPADDTGAMDAGSAYTYNVSSSTPTAVVAVLNSPGPSGGDHFGSTVAVSGTRAVVGFPDVENGSGGANVFNLSGNSSASSIARLSFPSPAAADHAGTSVSISGDWVVVGVPDKDIGAVNAGRAYVFNLSGNTPSNPFAILNNPSPSAEGRFGISVAVSGNLVVVGTPGHNDTAPGAGCVYVFDVSSATPTVPVAVLTKPNAVANDGFGTAVAIAGSLVVVGVPADDTAFAEAGSVYVYDLSSNTPTVPFAVLNNPSPTFADYFGATVAISGMRVAVGTYGDDTGGNESGCVYVYDLAGGTPTVPTATLYNPTPQAGDYFGISLGIFGTRVVVGSHLDDTAATDAGSGYVYDLASPQPTVPVATLSKPASAANDRFGSSVAISNIRVVVGAPYDHRTMLDKGAAYVYGYDDTATLPPILMTPAVGARVGSPVAVTFSLPEAGLDFSLAMVIKFTGESNGVEVKLNPNASARSEGAHTFCIDAGNPGASPGIESSSGHPTIPDGIYTVEISYADAWGHISATDSHEKIVVDLTPPSGGGFTVNPRGPAFEGTPVVLSASGWGDDGGPLKYRFLADNGSGTVPLSASAAASSLEVNLSPGTYTLSVEVIDSLGNMTTAGPITTTIKPPPIDPVSERFYTRGEEVPGAGVAGVNSEISAGATWYTFGVPAVDEEGRVAVVGKWKNPRGSESGTYGSGLFVDDKLIVAIGSHVPGIAGAKFKSFKDPVISGGHLALIATLSGVPSYKDTVVIETTPAGVVTVLAQEGEAAMGTGGATFKTFKGVSIAGGSTPGGLYTAVLRAGSGSPAVVAGKDQGAWLFSDGWTVLVVRSGSIVAGQTPSESVATFDLLHNVGGSPGQGRGFAGPDSTTFVAKARTGLPLLLKHDGSSLRFVGSTLQFSKWKASGPLADSTAALALRGSLPISEDGVNSRLGNGIFLGSLDGNSWEPVAELAGATPESGLNFRALKDPVLAPDGSSLAFPATLAGAGVTAASDTSLWWKPDSSPLTLLAREGSLAVGGGTWKAFTSLAYPGEGTGPIFLASLRQGSDGITAANDVGVWGVDSIGDLRLLFREGDTIAGKIVKSMAVLKAVSGSPGTTHAHNVNGTIVWRATYTDGASGIVVTTVP